MGYAPRPGGGWREHRVRRFWRRLVTRRAAHAGSARRPGVRRRRPRCRAPATPTDASVRRPSRRHRAAGPVCRYRAAPGVYDYTSPDGSATFPTAALSSASRPSKTLSSAPATPCRGSPAPTKRAPSSKTCRSTAPVTRRARRPVGPQRPSLRRHGRTAGVTPLAVFNNGSSLAQFRRYDGSGPERRGELEPSVDIGYADTPTSPAGPPACSCCRVRPTARSPSAASMAPRLSLGSKSWTVARRSTATSPRIPRGRLHAVVPRGDVDGFHLVHATSDDGAAWRSGTAVTQTDGAIGEPRAAVAGDHVGVVVWSTRHHRAARRDQGDPHSGGDRARDAPVRRASPPPPPSLSHTKRRARRARRCDHLKARLPTGSKPPATAARLANGSVRVVIKGVLGRPAGVSRSRGCSGTVRVGVKGGKRAIGGKTVQGDPGSPPSTASCCSPRPRSGRPASSR